MDPCCQAQREALLAGEEAPEHCHCAQCLDFSAGLIEVGTLLSELEPPDLPLGFRTRLQARLREEAAVDRRPWYLRWRVPALATATAFALALFFMLPTGNLDLPAGSHVQATLQLASATPIRDVELQLNLPEGLQLLGAEQQRQLNWSSDLGPEVQEQKLALKASKPGRWQLELLATDASGRALRKSIWVEVEATASGQLTLQVEGELRLFLAHRRFEGDDHG